MFLGFNALVSSQGVSIELSAKWVKGYDIFKKDSIIYFPELMITYRNISDTSFYFQKVSDSRYGLPSLPAAIFRLRTILLSNRVLPLRDR